MPRKLKDKKLMKNRYMITLPESYSEYMSNIGPLSTGIQLLIAENVIGCSVQHFKSTLYPTKGEMDTRQHATDSIVSEMIRMARWMLEGKVIAIGTSKIDPTLFLQVRWDITGQTNWVYVSHKLVGGFKHVIYDGVMDIDTEVYSVSEHPMQWVGVKGVDLRMNGRMDYIARWIELSEGRR